MFVPFWGAPDGAVPGRSFPHGLQAPPLVDATGIPLAVALTGGNRNDVTQLFPLLEDLHARPVAGKRGRPRRSPTGSSPTAAMTTTSTAGCSGPARNQTGDRAPRHRARLRAGRQRWVVERGFAHLHNFRRLRIRYERYPEIHTALLVLACSILCWRRLRSL